MRIFSQMRCVLGVCQVCFRCVLGVLGVCQVCVVRVINGILSQVGDVKWAGVL